MNSANYFENLLNAAAFNQSISVGQTNGKTPLAQRFGYAETGILIPQPPRRRMQEQRIVISFFFTSGWDVEIEKL
jgi:hypothetical protein